MTVARSNFASVFGLNLRQAAVPLVALVAVIALGWFFTVRQAGGMDGDMAGTMGLDLVAFLVMWLPMVVAMMFPTVGPSAVMSVHGDQAGVARRAVTARATTFLVAYLVVWMLFGLAVFLVLDLAIERISLSPDAAKWVAAGIYAAAGLYQFTPFKDRCREQCRSTRCAYAEQGSTFGQTVREAVRHGSFCIGCCAAFMVVLIAVGMANIAVMAAFTVVIFVERHVFRRAVVVSRVAGALLLLAALLTPFLSWLHPGLPATGEMPAEMPGEMPM